MPIEEIRVSTYALAVSYRESANLLVDLLAPEQSVAGHKIFPAMFLYSHAIELFLKEYLRLKEHREKKSFGHNLTRLWATAKSEGITLAPPNQMDSLISNLRSGHEDYQFRYSDRSFNTSGPYWMRRDVEKLADAVAIEVERKRKEHADKPVKPGYVAIPLIQATFISIDIDRPPKPTT
jgi:hypothetical protein